MRQFMVKIHVPSFDYEVMVNAQVPWEAQDKAFEEFMESDAYRRATEDADVEVSEA